MSIFILITLLIKMDSALKNFTFLDLCLPSVFGSSSQNELDEGRVRLFRIESKAISFTYFRKRNILISSNCIKKNKLECSAFQISRDANENIWNDMDLKDGTNPGSVLCKRMKGAVHLGWDKTGNQVGFCKFIDQSFISLGSLVSQFKNL